MKRAPYSRRIFVAMNYSSLALPLGISKKFDYFVFLLALSSVLAFARLGQAQTFTGTLGCGKTDTIDIGPVLTLDTVDYPVSLINKFVSDASWTLSHPSSNFRIVEDSGRALQDSAWSAHILFGPGTTLGSISTADTVHASSCDAYLFLRAQVIGPTGDSTTFSIQTPSPQVIAFKTSNATDTGLFYFKNDTSASIVIDSIKITQTSAFAITSAPSLPYTLHSQDSFAIGLSYRRTSQGSDNGDLLVSMPNHPIAPFEVALQGVRVANDAVQPQPAASMSLWLYPNPAQGPVTIHTENLTNAHVTITDVLGRAEREASFQGDWQWDRQTEGGSFAPSGTYFLVVTGMDRNGKAVQQVERFVLE